jgi:ribonucleotide reductase alpha subunit
MKKIWLLTTLLVAGLLLTGCNKSVNVENEQERIFACWRSVSEYLGISDYSINWDIEEEAWASFVLNWEITFEENWETVHKTIQCVVDMVENSVEINPYSDKSDEEFEVDQSEISE